MKSSEAKTPAASSTHNSSFFHKETGRSFFGKNETFDPFFKKQDSPAIQTKLTIGQPGDIYEQEADAMADNVVQRLGAPETVQTRPDKLSNSFTPFIQTKCTSCEEEEKAQKKEEDGNLPGDNLHLKPIFESDAIPKEEEIQRKCDACEDEEKVQKKGPDNSSEDHSSALLKNRLLSTKGSGIALPHETQAQMESSFGADFGNVRIHTGSDAVQMSQDLHAQAFTHGSDIYFNNGKFNPGSSGGKHLLAHELTHTLQQDRSVHRKIYREVEINYDNIAETDQLPEEQMDAIEEETRRDMSSDDFGGYPGLEELPENQTEPEEDFADTNDVDDVDIEEIAGEDESTEMPGVVPDNTPTVQSTPGACPSIIPEYPQPEENASMEASNQSIYEELLGFVSGDLPGIGLFNPLSYLGRGAFFIWRQLPQWIKVKAINYALDAAIKGAYFGRLIGRYTGFGLGLLSAALTGFYKKMKTLPDRQKISLFEKTAGIVLGRDIAFTWGLIKGIVIGFFIDGLIGIIQMIIDIVCLVPKIIDFFKTLADFIKHIPMELQLVMVEIEEMLASIGDVVNNAVSELMDYIKNPDKIINIINTIYDAGASMAEKMGEKIAGTMIRYASLSSERLGMVTGRISGQLLFEGVLAYLTGGAGAAVSAAKVGVRIVARALTSIGKYIFQIIWFLGKILTFVRSIIVKIIRFLTPLMKIVASMARGIIDKLSGLFRLFRRSCRPGSVVCSVPKPKCRGTYVKRMGGHPRHDPYVTRVTGQSRDYRLRSQFFNVPAVCNYDAKVGPLLVEGKTGYRYLPFIQQSRPYLFRMIMLRFNEQRFRCMAIAARCGHPYVWYMEQKDPAEFLAFRWHGLPPVLHRP